MGEAFIACDSNTKHCSKISVNSLTSALTIHIAQVSKFQQHYIPADGNIQTIKQLKKYRRRGLNHTPNYCNTFMRRSGMKLRRGWGKSNRANWRLASAQVTVV